MIDAPVQLDDLPVGSSVTVPVDWLRDVLSKRGTDSARELSTPEDNRIDQSVADRMLRAPEVAERMNVAVRTVYKNAHALPFAKRYPTGAIRFSEAGLDRWLARRT